MVDKGRVIRLEQQDENPFSLKEKCGSVCFAVGLDLYLEFELHRKKRRAQCELIGWLNKKLLITTCAIFEDRHLLTQEGKEFLVRFLHEGSVYGFVTKLLKKHQYPVAVWFLEYPRAIETINLRNTPRLNVLLAAKSNTGSVYHIMNISASGAYLSVNNDKFDIDDEVVLSFTLPNGVPVEEIRARIVRFQFTPEENFLGIRFIHNQREKMWRIGDYINQYRMIHGKD